MSTRSTEELNRDARGLAYAEEYSLTEGWDDNKVAVLFRLGLNKLYQAITESDQPANIEEAALSSEAGISAYDLPIDVHMAIRINDARFYWGPQSYNFTTLTQRPIAERIDYTTLHPVSFAIRDGQIILTPAPGISKDDSIVLNYQKRMRTLDFRRGQVDTIKGAVVDGAQAGVNIITVDAGHTVAVGDTVQFLDRTGTADVQRTISAKAATTVTVSGDVVDVNDDDTIRVASPMTFTLTFPSNSAKWATMQDNSAELDRTEYICIVDRDGTPIVSQIPIDSYSTTTYVVTVATTYTMPISEMSALDTCLSAGKPLYVVMGRYSSTHSELDMVTENYLIEYVILRLLRLQSNTGQSKDQFVNEQETLQRMATAYKRYRKSVYSVRFIDTLRAGRSVRRHGVI